MMTARHTGIACLAVLFCMFPSALGVSASAPTRWDARLEALDPTRPLDYFLLGEEVADAATNVNLRVNCSVSLAPLIAIDSRAAPHLVAHRSRRRRLRSVACKPQLPSLVVRSM